jgi:hypothetical protein
VVQGAEFLVPGLLYLDKGSDPAFGDDGPTFKVAGESDERREVVQEQGGRTWSNSWAKAEGLCGDSGYGNDLAE